jgi:lipid-binding SYLF domain-containing protein
MKTLPLLGCLFAATLLTACGSTPTSLSESDKKLLNTQAASALADFHKADPTLKAVLDKSVGYAIFPEIVNGAFVVGGAHGMGEVYSKGKLVGYADVSLANVGFQIGGQKFSQLVVFMNDAKLAEFQASETTFDAKASAVATSAGAAGSADYSKGVLVFAYAQSGLMAQAAIGGQKFRYIAASDAK